MTVRWEALTIDSREPDSLARWWAHTLGWETQDPSPEGVEVRSPEGNSPSLFFIRVDDPKPAKNRLHLDLHAEDQAAAVDDLLARGATRAAVGQADDAEWVVLRDPEGNEFCVL